MKVNKIKFEFNKLKNIGSPHDENVDAAEDETEQKRGRGSAGRLMGRHRPAGWRAS
jgi:hypothetical protein